MIRATDPITVRLWEQSHSGASYAVQITSPKGAIGNSFATLELALAFIARQVRINLGME